MENNLPNKAKFFTQYWWQKVFVIKSEEPPYNNWRSEDLEKAYVLLKPLESITDEEFIKSLSILGKSFDINSDKDLIEDLKDSFVEGFKNKEFYGTFYPYRVMELIDYLRSKGYALPWMGLSVEKLVEYNWIKLKI